MLENVNMYKNFEKASSIYTWKLPVYSGVFILAIKGMKT